MKAVTVKELKQELSTRTATELIEVCLQLSKFKKENKELLTYLLFEITNEQGYIESVKLEIDNLFNQVNKKSIYLIRKGVRKVLSNTKKYIRYSKKKETEVELLIYFCRQLKTNIPSLYKSTRLQNIYLTQLTLIKKRVLTLHEDIQYDFKEEIENL
jgi:hypothetical protein